MSSVDTTDTHDERGGPLAGLQFPALDTLRAVGALAVLVTHTSFWAGAYTQHGPIGPLLARMDVGVAIFFVLSGFLLSRPWLTSAAVGRPGPSVPRYFWKRILRIFPVYLVTAVIALALIEGNRGLGLRDWLVTIGLADIYVNAQLPAGLTQMWTLATEVAFYLVLPLLMLLTLCSRNRLAPRRVLGVLAAMVAASLAWFGFVGSMVPGSEQLPVNEWLPAFLSWFAVGVGLALAHTIYVHGHGGAPWHRTVEAVAAAPGVCWVMALGLLLVASTSIAGPTSLEPPTGAEAVTKNLLYAGIGGLLVFSGVFATPQSTYSALMSHPWLRHLGHISYGLFCIHLPVMHLVMWSTGYKLFDGHLPQIFLLTLVLSVAAAELLYRLVELPFMRLRNLGRSGPATTTSPADTATSTK